MLRINPTGHIKVTSICTASSYIGVNNYRLIIWIAVINKINAYLQAGGTLSDLTVLDLSALGIKGLQDMVITETQGATAAANTVTIKSGLAQNFVIGLSGVYKDQLDLANFKFAV